ncbi:hypothetical protein BJV82DRAFT_611554 [Fennellomyces sp. T-0311]|nr:hypothetical protein BJV82DRAFT_611554 [Fennellomyces sp. T-0311]
MAHVLSLCLISSWSSYICSNHGLLSSFFLDRHISIASIAFSYRDYTGSGLLLHGIQKYRVMYTVPVSHHSA